MKTNNLIKILTDFEQKIIEIDFDKLPISDYNKKYIANIKSAHCYYINIYAYVQSVMRSITLLNKDIIMVDYGGGCGFFSILAKMLGVHKVIYIDRNPDSVKTVKVVGLDVIEHIYNLRHFFADISSLNQNLSLVFMTGSNPKNFWKCRKLRKEMDAYEKGNAATPNYYTKRLEFIKRTYPDMEKSKAHEYAAITRGMNYEDIQYFIQSNNYDGTGAATLTGYQDKHNTCDPETGNYMERILPLKEYRYLLSGEEDGLCFIQVGFYNLFGKNKLKNLCAMIANKLIRSIGAWGIRISPFIIITSIRYRLEK